jgi:hypothetical protein
MVPISPSAFWSHELRLSLERGLLPSDHKLKACAITDSIQTSLNGSLVGAIFMI